MRTIKEILKNTPYTPVELELFLTECYLDFLYFAEHVMGFDIAEYHREWLKLAEVFPRLCIIAFRGSGKTSFFCAYFIWKAIFSKKELNFLVVSHNFEQSKLVLKLIRNMITGNELLKQFVPESKEYSWKATELTLKNGCTFYCKTYGEGVRGLRIDYALCDEAGMYEDKSIFWTAITPTIQLNRGRMIVIGTSKTSIDLLAELKENEEYMTMEYPAEKKGKPLWPQKYTLKEHDEENKRSLKQIRKEMGELQYMQEYMLVPISSANSLFPYELTLSCVSKEKNFLPYGKINERYYIGYDYALSPTGDWVVMTVLSANNDKKEIVNARRFKGSSKQQTEVLKKLIKDFNPVKICMDATGLGQDQAENLKKEIPNLEPIKFNYDEKYKMLLDLRNEFERRNIIIPSGKDPATYSYAQQLLKELNDFSLVLRAEKSTRPKFSSGQFDDCVISLALANRASIDQSGTLSISSFE